MRHLFYVSVLHDPRKKRIFWVEVAESIRIFVPTESQRGGGAIRPFDMCVLPEP